MIQIDYACNACGRHETNQTLDSFVCQCGGEYKVDKNFYAQGTSANFEPHFDPTIKQYVTSWKDKEKKGKAFRSENFPNGLLVTDPKWKGQQELDYIRKHKEDYIQGQWAKDGQRYIPGSQMRFSEKRKELIPQKVWEREKAMGLE